MNIVLEVKDNRAVLLDDNGKMQIVRNKNYKVGQSVVYHRSSAVYRVCAMAACFMLALFCSAAGYYSYFAPAAYLSVDINPSIQLEINRFEKVIEAQAFNDEGNLILDSIKLKNNDVKYAVEKIIEKAQENGYLTEDENGVILDIATARDDIIEDVSEITGEYKDKKIDVVMEQSTDEDVKFAKRLNVSIGRVKALREYLEDFGGDIESNNEALKGNSVKELREKNKKKNDKKTDMDNDNNITGTEKSGIEIKKEEKAAGKDERQSGKNQSAGAEPEKEVKDRTEETKKDIPKQSAGEAKKAEKQAEKQTDKAVKKYENQSKETGKEAEKSNKGRVNKNK